MLAWWTDLIKDRRADVCSFLNFCSRQKSTVCTYSSRRTRLFGSGKSNLNTVLKALSEGRTVSVMCTWVTACLQNVHEYICKKPLQIRNSQHFVDFLHVMIIYICPTNTNMKVFKFLHFLQTVCVCVCNFTIFSVMEKSIVNYWKSDTDLTIAVL